MRGLPPFPEDFQLVLASQSPRRHSMLRDLGVPFTVVKSEAEEVLEGADVRALAERNARAKVEGAALSPDLSQQAFVLGTDTIVCVDGRALGKPASPAEAGEMLRLLAGRTHEVISGVALTRGGREQVASAVTAVTFLPLGEEDVSAYVASGEWKGKAGGYAVQGLAALFVSSLHGEYSNVVGLPLCLLARCFAALGFDILKRTWT